MARKLTAKQEAFAAALARGLKATDAYREAFDAARMTPAAVRANAQKLRNHTAIALRVRELTAQVVENVQKAVEVDLPKVLFENCRLGFSDIRRVLTDAGEVRDPKDWDDDSAAAVQAFETERFEILDEDGNVKAVKTKRKVKLWSKSNALDNLGRHFGMYEKDNAQRAANLFAGLPRETVKQIVEALARGRRPLLG